MHNTQSNPWGFDLAPGGPLHVEYTKCHHGVEVRFHCHECEDEKNRLFQSAVKASQEPPKRIPIYRGCQAQGGCFCTGRCKDIVGYRDPAYPGER